MAEAVLFQLPTAARRTFAVILMNATNTNFRTLWEKYKALMINQHRFQLPEIMEHYALHHLAEVLALSGRNLSDFNLPDFNQTFIDVVKDMDIKDNSTDIYMKAIKQMNPGQRAIMKQFLTLLDGSKLDKNHCMFCQAAGGTGKSFTFNAILHASKSKGK